jgi:hypothetical protein
MDTRSGENLNYGWSFRTQGTGPMRASCGYARRSIPNTLKAVTDVMIVQQKRKASPQYAEFFGAYKTEQTSVVNHNIQSMLFGIMSSTMWLYYRGRSLAPSKTHTDWPYLFGELSGLQAEDNGGATITPKQRKAGGMRPHRNAQQTDNGIHIKLGKQVEGKSDSEMHHTIIHEMSHFICGTRDVKMPALTMLKLLGGKFTISQQMALMDKFVLKGDGANRFISKDEFHERTGKQHKLPKGCQPTGAALGAPCIPTAGGRCRWRKPAKSGAKPVAATTHAVRAADLTQPQAQAQESRHQHHRESHRQFRTDRLPRTAEGHGDRLAVDTPGSVTARNAITRDLAWSRLDLRVDGSAPATPAQR